MSRLFSASVDDTPCSKGRNDATKSFPFRLSHTTSAIELRSHAGFAAPLRRQGYCLRGARRTGLSLPLGDISHNICYSTSKSGSTCTPEPFPSLNASDCEEGHQNVESVAEVYLSPPASESGDFVPSDVESLASQHLDSLPFPLNPVFLPNLNSNAVANKVYTPLTPSRRRPGVRNYSTPLATPDRYMSNRFSPQDASKTFRISKSPHKLSSRERLLRHPSATPDPFSPLIVPRRREAQNTTLVNRDALARPVRPRTIGVTNVLALPQDTLALQNRQVSAGAVWNVGGSTTATHSGPIRSISDGRGGFFSSGSNAPMFMFHFFDDDLLDHNMERMESRLAAALDIDLTSRVLNHSRLSPASRSASTGSVGIKRKAPYIQPRTDWRHGEWTQGGSRSLLDAPSLRDDYYCTVLAYCHTAHVLAVGLGNRVYLWSEAVGVQYPPELNTGRGTYVTSISFSSTEGGHSILAIGRNSGQISLYGLYDRENIRFQSQQPRAVSCLAFKPVTTRRPSERFGCMMATEEILVGDEGGNVYYYSVEWMSKQQVDIHGWTGAMTLMAKISVHSQQICGLAWSPDGEFFATGANDNACCLFSSTDILTAPETSQDASAIHRSPFHTFLGGFGLPNFIARARTPSDFMAAMANGGLPVQRTRIVPGQDGSLLVGEGRQKHRWMHSAAIKAIAFCPWQRSLIATGGGSNDRAIHFYHVHSGACLATITVHAQVTSLIWSTTRREIAATFGYAQPDHMYRIAVFSWPECKQVVAIPWASDMRALYAIPYPGGPGETATESSLGETWSSRTKEEGCIVVACSDESVKFHEVWSGPSKSTSVHAGLLGGSAILEGLEGIDNDGMEIIR